MPALPAHVALNHTPVPLVRPAPAAAAGGSPQRGAGAMASDGRLTVHSHGYTYAVSGNTLLPAKRVRAVLQAAADPRKAVGQLRKAYLDQGYFLVAVVGRLHGTQVRLRVVQGRLTHVDGPASLTRFFSGLKGDPSVKDSDIIRHSILAQSYAATNGKQPQVQFKPAPETGGSQMQISRKPVKGYFPVGGSLTVGNFGNRYAGHYLAQAQADVRHDGYTLQVSHTRALTGLDANTRGAYYSATGIDLSNINPWGVYKLDYTYTRYQLGNAFAPLFPAGRIKRFGISGTQFLYADDSSRWTLEESLHHLRDTETVFNGIYTLRDQQYNVLKLGSDYSRRFTGLLQHAASVSAGGSVKFGFASGGANGFDAGVRGAPTQHFRIYNANLGITQTLPRDFSLKLDVKGQASTNTLPSYQQWVLGGLNNLTAYLPGTIVGDRGYLGRLTLQGPQWDLGPVHMRPSVFTEHGAARYSYIAPKAPKWQRLTDAGAGLGISVPVAHTSAMLAYAKPVNSDNVTGKLRRGQVAHLFFYLQVGF